MTINSMSKMGLAFAVGVALSAGYVAIGAQRVSEPKVVVVQERCDEIAEEVAPAPENEPSPELGLAHDPPYYVVDQAELEAMARRCEIRDDAPARLDDAIAAALGLSEDERKAWELAEARVHGAEAAIVFGLLKELEPDAPIPSGDAAHRRLGELLRDRDNRAQSDREIHRALAEERAGLREPRSKERLAVTDAWTRAVRFRLTKGDRFAAELALGIGRARVEELRRKFGGWPGSGVRLISCAEGTVAASTVAGFMVEGQVPRDIIRRVVRAHMSEVRSCYEKALIVEPGLAGTLQVEFVITSEGKVDTVEFAESSTLEHPATRDCVAEAVQRWIFPKPREGAVTVRYPFVLAAE